MGRCYDGPVLAAHRVTLIPGDGVGPEVSEATRRVLEATGVEFDWDVQNAGLGVVKQYGTPMPDHVLESIRRNKVAIKGPLTTPIGKGIRSVNFAFNYARTHGRRKVTAVHKANIMKFTDGLFLQVAEEIAKEHPDMQFNDRIVDNMSMQLVQNPREYDVIVMPNLYGDILSDLCAGLVGGLGLAPGANLGDEIALFEATHGSAPKYAGTNKINPMAMMLSGVMMLRHLGETYAANMLEGAIAETIREGRHVTYDMKAERNDPSAVGTTQVTDAIVARLETARTPTTI